MTNALNYFNDLNKDYLHVHKTKEDLFWSTYMGTSEDHKGFASAETSFKKFVSNPDRISEIKDLINQLASEADTEQIKSLKFGLTGWLNFFKCNVIESDKAQKMMDELVQLEADLFARRKDFTLSYIDENGKTKEASTLVLRSNLTANQDESVRRSSHQGFLDLERWVVENGYLDLVKKRNQFARELGYQNFFDYSVQKNEAMTPNQLFKILDDFETQTRTANQNSLQELAKNKGESALEGHNFKYAVGGDVERELDPYMPFSKSLARWVNSFKRLGINYMGADLTLDLLDRKGKYENGFMHGPMSCYFEQEKWQPAKINFTSNANPDKIGSGHDALATLFHEGGHAAHFSTITLQAPCFSQEYAPTSMAYAETQSMFCDSLLGDADWLKKYAFNSEGEVIPDALIEKMIIAKQPFFAFGERSILAVPKFEWAVYSMDESELTPDNLIKLARKTEKSVLGVKCSSRPLLSIPHLLSQESACAYHGYLLAHMAVYQTRAWFKKEHGFLTDNPKVGPLLTKHYWNPGNSISHNQTLINLTGEGFSAQYLADCCNQTVEESWNKAEAMIELSSNTEQDITRTSTINANIRIVNGNEVIADNKDSDESMIQQFETWINKHY